MGPLLQIVGFGWAAVGVYYLWTLFTGGVSQGAIGLGVVLAMVLCVLPGLGLAGLGWYIEGKAQD